MNRNLHLPSLLCVPVIEIWYPLGACALAAWRLFDSFATNNRFSLTSSTQIVENNKNSWQITWQKVLNSTFMGNLTVGFLLIVIEIMTSMCRMWTSFYRVVIIRLKKVTVHYFKVWLLVNRKCRRVTRLLVVIKTSSSSIVRYGLSRLFIWSEVKPSISICAGSDCDTIIIYRINSVAACQHHTTAAWSYYFKIFLPESKAIFHLETNFNYLNKSVKLHIFNRLLPTFRIPSDN